MGLPVTPGAYEPGNIARGSTVATWRLARPILQPDRCTLCLWCWIYCPDSAIQIKEECVDFDMGLCKGCGICAEECPHNAIGMTPEV